MSEVTIVDTSPRDGPVALPKIRTSGKIALANRLMQSGSIKIDCVAFTHPRLRPEYADAEKVMEGLEKRPGVKVIGIAPNEIACRRALSTNIDEIGLLIAGSESFNLSILGISIRKTLYKTFPAIIQACLEKGKTIRAYLLTAFSCQYEGRVPIKNIVELASKLSFLGVNEISLVDTPGTANPRQVKDTIAALQDLNLEANLAVHFHNPRGLGLANCVAAYEAGVRIFDTAIGGLSGTPFGAPKMEAGAWNVPTEDLVFLFEEMGVSTGINLDTLFDALKLAQEMAGQELFGHVLKAKRAFDISNFPEPLKIQ
ncbi:MAG: hydroxymethylglutaryl-CoA lyase [Deltaproteobacteria bacterium]|nr:hydroxymethylglutaryl-CoA lyase [Deltaproteobacteria bacterium]